MEGEIDFLFPMMERLDIKFPSNLSSHLSNLEFGISSIWTLPFQIHQKQYFFTFLISKIFIWNKEKKSKEINVKGILQRNKALFVDADNQYCLYFVLNDNCLYCMKNFLKTDKIEPFQVKAEGNILEVEYITTSFDHTKAIVLTKDQRIYFVDSNGTVDSKYRLSNKLSFIKDLGNGDYIGVAQNIIYQLNIKFERVQYIPMTQYSVVQDIIGPIEEAIIIGYSKNEGIKLTKFSFSDASIEDNSIIIGLVNFESFFVLKNDNHSSPYLCFVSESEIVLLDNNFFIIGRRTISNPDFLISSFTINENNSDNLFVHFSKSGIHSFTLFNSRNMSFSDKNPREVILYFLYLFNASNDKGKIVSNFYESLTEIAKDTSLSLGEFISKFEKDEFKIHHSQWTTDKMFSFHKYLISMLETTQDSQELIPFLNTNKIYLHLIENSLEDEDLYLFSSFEKLDQLIQRFTVSSSQILLDSIHDLRHFSNDNFLKFDGYQDLYDLIERLLTESEDKPLVKLQLVECKHLLTGENIDVKCLDLNKNLINYIDEFEQFALKYDIIDILYEIICRTLDFKRAIKYSGIKNLDKLFYRFSPDIQQKLAILKGWEKFDIFLTYENGEILESQDNASQQFSYNAFSLLCESFMDDPNVEKAVNQLNIQLS